MKDDPKEKARPLPRRQRRVLYDAPRRPRKPLPKNGYDALIPADAIFQCFARELHTVRKVRKEIRRRVRAPRDRALAQLMQEEAFYQLEGYCSSVGWAVRACHDRGGKTRGYGRIDFIGYEDPGEWEED